MEAGTARPGQSRASAMGSHRTPGARPVTGGLSSRALSEIFRLERTRDYPRPGDFSAAEGLWNAYVHRPERTLWHDYGWGNVHSYRRGNPSKPAPSSTR
ncbi:hypothetical protein [Streptomyces sp. DW26H14]|uniref:hypothetical protein n=1 Tax=Streptomyces sp. DW26H14 TaxID=3435395 RepID=UPI00403E1A52